MAAGGLPSGTLTFVFTDVEGSTRRWERDPSGMTVALAEHDAVVRGAIEGRGGYVFATGGDGFAAAFSDPVAAVGAAVEVQERVGLAVRVGVHTGTAEERDGNYFGPTLNQTARLMSAGHGGQILVSEVTAALVRGEVELTDLGVHRLADVATPVHVWQVGSGRFAPLRSLSGASGNVLVPLDSFIGRDNEVATLAGLIAGARLVSVIGVGGMGKTRLAVETAARLGDRFDDGVWFVDLGVARHDTAVAEQVAATLGVHPGQGQSVEDRLVEYLEHRDVLLVLDNCEQVMRPTAALVDRLLRGGGGVRVIATSREALLVPGEQVMALGPLAVDTDDGAVELFVDRVRAERGAFEPDATEVDAIGELCARLDGMPLAIELAAARARSLGVAGVVDRLEQRFRLLAGGWRTGLERHQTLQATVDWSYDLLSEMERSVFDRLGVFVGWFTIDDAVAVAGGDGIDELDVIDAVSGLVDKSMCTLDVSVVPARYRYLETMRAYARTHLTDTGQIATYRSRHAEHLADLCRQLEHDMMGPGEVAAATEIDARAGDLRAALEWAVAAGLGELEDAIAAVALLQGPWRGSFEMSGWCYELRDQVGSFALDQAVTYAFMALGDLDETRRLADRALATWTSDRAPVCSLMMSGWAAFVSGNTEETVSRHEQLFRRSLSSDHPADRLMGMWARAASLAVAGQDTRRLAEEVIELASAKGWRSMEASGHYAHGRALQNIDVPASLDAYDRALTLAVDVGSRQVEVITRRERLTLQAANLPPDELATEVVSLLAHLREMSNTVDTIGALELAAELLARVGRVNAAAPIVGWLDGRSSRTEDSREAFRTAMAEVETLLGDRADELIEHGRHQSLDEILDTTFAELETIN